MAAVNLLFVTRASAVDARRVLAVARALGASPTEAAPARAWPSWSRPSSAWSSAGPRASRSSTPSRLAPRRGAATAPAGRSGRPHAAHRRRSDRDTRAVGGPPSDRRDAARGLSRRKTWSSTPPATPLAMQRRVSGPSADQGAALLSVVPGRARSDDAPPCSWGTNHAAPTRVSGPRLVRPKPRPLVGTGCGRGISGPRGRVGDLDPMFRGGASASRS